jgi:hypothetical protein
MDFVLQPRERTAFFTNNLSDKIILYPFAIYESLGEAGFNDKNFGHYRAHEEASGAGRNALIARHIIQHSLCYALIANLYLLAMMITTSPRVWGYNDYSHIIKDKVPPQTKKERILAAILGVPWILLMLIFPVVSVLQLKSNLGGEITFLIAFLNIYLMIQLAGLIDLLVLDWLIVSKLTPGFVIIEGSKVEDYKDFSHHFRGHLRATIILTGVAAVFALVTHLI